MIDYFQTKVIEWLDNIESGVMIPVYGHKLISGSDLVIQSYIVPKNSAEKELESDEESATFSYDVKLTYDFMQLIMQQGDQVEILEPKKLRDQMRNLAKTLTSYYKD